LARRGHRVTTYDFRRYPERHPNLTSIEGDWLQNDLPSNSYDRVLFISAIEHIGFGSYGAPVAEDADFQALGEALRILKTSGRLILTFPFADKMRHIEGFERWYDVNRVRILLKGLHILAEEYYAPRRTIRGRIVDWRSASLKEIVVGDVLERFGSQCNACFAVAPRPCHLGANLGKLTGMADNR
jgi:hypothetical protein